MRKSIITVKCYYDKCFGEERFKEPVFWIEEMLIPNVIGKLIKGFKQLFYIKRYYNRA